MRLLKVTEVIKIVGLSRTSIWRLSSEGRFPSPVRLSSNRIGWKEQEVLDWIGGLPAVVSKPEENG